MNNINLSKEYAVYSNDSSTSQTTASEMIDNLIHEANKMELNTYQSFVRNLMDPRSDLRSLMLLHMTGTGKTITALATATEYVKAYSKSTTTEDIASIIVLGFTKNIFMRELLSHTEFEFVNIDELNELKVLASNINVSTDVSDKYAAKRKQYHRRLFNRGVKGIYQFYGYRQFANKIINMEDVQSMIKKQNALNPDVRDLSEIDPRLIQEWVETGKVRINIPFIQTLAKSFIICDEVHNLYKSNFLNSYGIAINIAFDYFYKTLAPVDKHYGSVRSLLLSATPLTSNAMEIIPIVKLLSGETLVVNDIFELNEGIHELTPKGSSIIRRSLSGKVSYVMDDNPKEYPSSSFSGNAIPYIKYLKFVRTTPKGHQLKYFKTLNVDNIENDNLETTERGMTMIKDIVLPAIEKSNNGVVFSKNIKDLHDLPNSLAVRKNKDDMYSSEIFQRKILESYSCKYSKLVDMCLEMKSTDHGKIFIYHPFITGSGINMIMSILSANGFLMNGHLPSSNSICMDCNDVFQKHNKTTKHKFRPVRMTYITGSLSKNEVSARLMSYNNDTNVFGENVKIIVGSKAMRESHTLKACRHIIVTREPSSISEMIQIIGRAVRKFVHLALPVDKRSVQIYLLTTNVSSIPSLEKNPSVNEEYSYHIKAKQYDQINRIENILYDIAIDYLINFRFKVREMPSLLGDAFTLDQKSYSVYEKDLTTAYTNLRNGVPLNSIATNRFNVFYFEGELKLVVMMIKRIILDHQPIITIRDLKELIRNPPFHVEYNTRLISDESIVVAISKISFNQSELQVNKELHSSLVELLYDQSSDILDIENRKYKIVCIGDLLCEDSYITKRTLSSLLSGELPNISLFKKTYIPETKSIIDLKQLSAVWASTINIDDVIEEINERTATGVIDIGDIVDKFPQDIHSKLVEWAIQKIADAGVKSKTLLLLNTLQSIITFYKSKKLIVCISDLKHTKVYDKYKRLDVDTGSTWMSASKSSTASMPIGHFIYEHIRLYQPSDSSWLELPSIALTAKKISYPYGFYLYQEKKNYLAVLRKVKLLSDPNSLGITIEFLPKTQLEFIATKLKVNIKGFSKKKDIIHAIELKALELQNKLYPNRVIYNLVDM